MHALIHISDIHFAADAALPYPPSSITAAVRGLNERLTSVSLVLTGDISYSGQQKEFEEVGKYLKDLSDLLAAEFHCTCRVFACPGNHDCCFPTDTAVRDLVVSHVKDAAALPSNESIIAQCLSVQENFFAWLRTVGSTPSLPTERLAWGASFPLNQSSTIHVRCLNSAWLSTLSETQGTLFFPPSLVVDASPAAVRITMIHHPYNWFRSPNARELRGSVEAVSDIILTGHEHDYDQYTKARTSRNAVDYVEAGIFAARDSLACDFNVVLIDDRKGQYRLVHVTHDGTRFTTAQQASVWTPFVRPTHALNRERILATEMQAFLKDPGLQLTHRAKDIVLEDIYIPPDLQTYEKLETSEAIAPAKIPSQHTINQLLEDRHAYILGEGQCGKTSLAKAIYLTAIRRGLTPVYLDGTRIQSGRKAQLDRLAEKALSEQYRDLSLELYLQLPPDERIAIVDDMSVMRLSRNARLAIASWLRESFGRVMVFGGEHTQVEELMADRDSESIFPEFRRYEIRPFGHRLRDLLIERWIRLSAVDSAEDALLHEVHQTARVVNTVLGNNLVPANPIFVLIVLQQLEAQIPLNTRSGSYGYLYEVLLTSALQRASKTPEDVDLKYSFLAELAWHMHTRDLHEVDEEQMTAFAAEHCERYALAQSSETIVTELTRSRVLQHTAGCYRFPYRYLAYYFIARYMRDNMDEGAVRTTLAKATQSLYREDHANILIFLTYLTKSTTVIMGILDRARAIFGRYPPCDLATHTTFLNQLQEEIPDIVLGEGDPMQHRRELLESTDSVDESARRGSERGLVAAESKEHLASMLELNEAVKILQVLGQIVRNFSGSLRRDLKADIVRECFDVGLRLLSGFFAALESNLDVSIASLANLFGRDIESLPESQRVKVAKSVVFLINALMCFGTLRRVSFAVGSESLLRTYEEVEGTYDSRAVRFVQLCLRLDHCRAFPESRVLELAREVGEDVFGITLLRMMVAEHFYLFDRGFRTRQKVCAKLGIAFERTVPRAQVAACLPRGSSDARGAGRGTSEEERTSEQ